MVTTDYPAVITPLVRQHAADAAFYWQQLNSSRLSALQSAEDITVFQHYLQANLDGLRIAGDEGWRQALQAFKRWKTQGEAYVCTRLAYQFGDQEKLDTCWQLVTSMPETSLEGHIAALITQPTDILLARLRTLYTAGDSLSLHVFLLASSQLTQLLAPDILQQAFDHDDENVRAAVCHYVVQQQQLTWLPHLQARLNDQSLMVRYSAAVAIGWLAAGQSTTFAQLWTVIEAYQQAPSRKGLAGLQHTQRLETLVRLAGQNFAASGDDINRVFAALPPYLTVLFLAHAGDARQLPHLLALCGENAQAESSDDTVKISNNAVAPLAFWAIHVLTGLNMEDSRYILLAMNHIDDENAVTDRVSQLSTGLYWPNLPVITPLCQEKISTSAPLLLGQPITVAHCQAVLATGRQVERYIANWHLFRQRTAEQHIDLSKDIF
ncbi:hypothetical protein [Serratia microhaemolytica]|uniref:hypothetical protein n=1 Tax=Serratia microhaemolytica TaxID=2675110 RepID=UPI000FDE9E54|nr:hypothetical protein [Serratia microhaemolytica]